MPLWICRKPHRLQSGELPTADRSRVAGVERPTHRDVTPRIRRGARSAKHQAGKAPGPRSRYVRYGCRFSNRCRITPHRGETLQKIESQMLILATMTAGSTLATAGPAG